MTGHLKNFSASGTRLLLDREIRPGAMVKVEWGGTILLGEIIYCRPEGSKFAVGLELEDALYETEEVALRSGTTTGPPDASTGNSRSGPRSTNK